MLWIKRLITLLIIVLALLLGIWFTLDNSQQISVVLFGFTLPSAKLGVWMLATFVVGIAVGFLASLWPYLAAKQKLLSQDRKIKRSERELDKLRAGSLKE